MGGAKMGWRWATTTTASPTAAPGRHGNVPNPTPRDCVTSACYVPRPTDAKSNMAPTITFLSLFSRDFSYSAVRSYFIHTFFCFRSLVRPRWAIRDDRHNVCANIQGADNDARKHHCHSLQTIFPKRKGCFFICVFFCEFFPFLWSFR